MKFALKPNRKRLRAWHVVALLLAAWPMLAWGAARALVERRELAHADTLVVLGGSAAYVERTRRAAELFRQGRAPRILLTNDNQRGGWSTAQQRNPFFVERALDELLRAGVPQDRIEVLPQPVTSTHDEALLLRDYALAHNLRSLLVVTSAYHTRRALWTLRRVFGESKIEFGLDAPTPGQTESPAPATWWLHARGWRAVALEYPKLIYYRLRYS